MLQKLRLRKTRKPFKLRVYKRDTHMNESLSLKTKPAAKPSEAIDQFIGDQFIDWVMSFIAAEINNWPEMDFLRTRRPKQEKVKKFLLQCFLADEAFIGGREGDPGFLRFAIANLSESDDPLAETALNILEARRTEELTGHKIEKEIIQTKNRELWLRLLKALGLSEEEIGRSEAKEYTRNYVAELSDILSNSEWQTAVGAFAVYDRAIPIEYKILTNLLKNATLLNDSDLEALTKRVNMYAQYESEGEHILEKVAFDKDSKALVWEGVEKHLALRKVFYAGLTKYLEG